MKKIPVLAIAVGSLALQQTSFAALEDFAVSLNGAQDGGGARTGSGSGTLTLDTVANTLTFNNISWGGLSADTTASHIHGPAAAGANTGVIYFLSSPATFTTTGAGIRSGTISGTMSLANPTQNGVTYSVASQIADLQNGLWYVNVHSTAFPGGEIRGQILPVPEPSTLALFGLGVGALAWRLRKRN